MIHTDPFVLKLIQYSMKAMTTQHYKANQFKIDESFTSKTKYESIGDKQN